MNMTQEDADEFERACKRFTKKICKSKESARAYLVKIGIYNEDGTLHKNYGG